MGRIRTILAAVILAAAPLTAITSSAHAATTHPARAQVISCAGPYYDFDNTAYGTGTIVYVSGIAYQEANYLSAMCPVWYGWIGTGPVSFYAYVIYGTNLCLTWKANLGYNRYQACDPNIAAQEWALYQGPGYGPDQYTPYDYYDYKALTSQGNGQPTYVSTFHTYDSQIWSVQVR